ncbi:MAG: Crp/Fnr family transcriptional regulator [bacterium]|nr:Crp/Fnr family transcriptional regulator [bacterium]
MKQEVYKILARSPIFKEIQPLKIEELLSKVPFRLAKHQKGNSIALRGQKCEALFVLVKGSVKCEMVDYNGKSIEVESISAPKPLAAAFIFGQKNFFPVDAVTKEDSVLLIIPKSSLISLFQLSSTLLKNFLDIISNRAHFLTERLWDTAFKSIKEKLANYILKLLEPGETRVVFPKNQQELSVLFGVSRPSLARVLKEMETGGIIEHKRREIFIKDLDKLEDIVS